MSETFEINGRAVGAGHPTYIIAEMSANHGHDFQEARRIVELAAEAGADAVKLQTYRADTMTIDCDKDYFTIGEGTEWEGQNLYELYEDAYTPWEWHGDLKDYANDLGMDLFSTPFDESAVDFLEELEVPAYKVASFEMTHLPLLKKIASTDKPIIMSTGMASLGEIDESVRAIRSVGDTPLILLKCTSAYPAPAEEANLKTIPHLADAFGVHTGLSDHTLGTAVPVTSVALGACVIEKHFIRDREEVESADSSFSLEPDEFSRMVDEVRTAEKAVGEVAYDVTDSQEASTAFRRSVFAVEDIKAGEAFTRENTRVIRPGYGLAPKQYGNVLEHEAAEDIERGTPIQWELLG